MVVLLTALAAVAVGVAPEALPMLAVLGACAAGLILLALIAARVLLSRRANRPSPTSLSASPGPAVAKPAVPGLRMARTFFYLGCVLLGESAFRYVGFTVSEAMFFASLGLCLWGALRGAAIPRLPTPMIAAAAVFVVGGAISSFDAQSPSGSAVQLMHALYVVLVWPWLAMMVLRTRAHVHVAIACWAASAALDGFGALAQLGHLHLPNLLAVSGRMTGFTEHPNDLGGVCAIALVPALLVALPETLGGGALLRVMRWMGAALVATGLALSGSVSSMAAAAVAVVFWLSSPSVRTPVRAVLAAAVVSGLIVLSIVGGNVSTPVQRLAQVGSATSQNGGSVQDRLSIAAAAWPRIQRDPFVGTGLDTADSVATIISHGEVTSYQIHGLALAAEYQTGIFGVLGLLALLAVVAALGWASMTAATTDTELLTSQALLAALVAFVIVAMVQPMVFQQYAWVTVVFVVAWRNLVVNPAVTASLAPIRRVGNLRTAEVGISRSMRAS